MGCLQPLPWCRLKNRISYHHGKVTGMGRPARSPATPADGAASVVQPGMRPRRRRELGLRRATTLADARPAARQPPAKFRAAFKKVEAGGRRHRHQPRRFRRVGRRPAVRSTTATMTCRGDSALIVPGRRRASGISCAAARRRRGADRSDPRRLHSPGSAHGTRLLRESEAEDRVQVGAAIGALLDDLAASCPAWTDRATATWHARQHDPSPSPHPVPQPTASARVPVTIW